MKHPIEIAKEKFAKDKDITPCQVVGRGKTKVFGVIYKGEFFHDCYLDGTEGQTAYVIEDDNCEGICLFNPKGSFVCWFKRGGLASEKVKVKP